MFGYIDMNGIVTHTPLESLFERKKTQVQKTEASHTIGDATNDQNSPLELSLRQKKAQSSYRQSVHYMDAELHNVKAAQIMSHPVVTVNVTTTIENVAEIFRHKRFRHIPVVTNDDKLAGIISDRDILKYQSQKILPDDTDPQSLSIATLMKTKVLFARPEAEIRQIVHILIVKKIGAIPIINDLSYVLGIITRSDILKHFVSNSPLDLTV